jgi:type IV pilus assembly protein PilO
MSSAVVVPPPNSSSVMRHVPRLTAHARKLLTAVNLHFAGVAALGVLILYLAVHLGLMMQALHANNADALAEEQNAARAAQIAAMPLRGLDVKLVNSTADADRFYDERLPYEVSQVLTELGKITKAQNVRLGRVAYNYSPELSGPAQLVEIRMDAALAGDYRPLVQAINAMERDNMFFVINSITFTGANGGQVNLRMRVTTYLRQPRPDEPLDDTRQAEDAAAAPPQAPKPIAKPPFPAAPRNGRPR